MKTYGNDSHFSFAFVRTAAVMQFSLDKETEKTISLLAIRVHKLLIVPSVLVPCAGFYLPPDGNHENYERIISESNENYTFGGTARRDIQVRATCDLRRPIVHSSASHQWYTPADGTFKCEPPVAHASVNVSRLFTENVFSRSTTRKLFDSFTAPFFYHNAWYFLTSTQSRKFKHF
ncbi:hypothetical protein AVEN_42979-1 [Araneus ventricosus]|uniref:Uncharacterized protein n=1 Tax=Araneus ventricosus TaxID=182803 RepID=A0A4Y2AFW9_ARAVE|nr:hypothetical protein AVEN_42979-1 [Araneus ventricosus]